METKTAIRLQREYARGANDMMKDWLLTVADAADTSESLLTFLKQSRAEIERLREGLAEIAADQTGETWSRSSRKRRDIARALLKDLPYGGP